MSKESLTVRSVLWGVRRFGSPLGRPVLWESSSRLFRFSTNLNHHRVKAWRHSSEPCLLPTSYPRRIDVEQISSASRSRTLSLHHKQSTVITRILLKRSELSHLSWSLSVYVFQAVELIPSFSCLVSSFTSTFHLFLDPNTKLFVQNTKRSWY